MKRIENRFWLTLECNPKRTTTLPDWRRAMGSEYGLFQNMVHPVEGLAQYVADPDDLDGRPLPVVDYGNGKYGAIDDDMIRRIPLTLDDIIRYTFKLNAFRTVLSEILGFEPVSDAIPPISLKPMRFGVCKIKPGVEFPVYVILAQDRRLMLEKTATLLTTEKNSFFLLTPTKRSWTQDILQLVRERKSQIVSLEECLLVENGNFVKSETWDNAVKEFRATHFPENLVEAPPLYEFRRKGEYWAIRFEGDDTYLKDTVGLRCIGQLLANPNALMFVMELRAILDGQNPDEVVQPGAREDVVDQETLTDLKRRYLELQSDLEEAQRDGNELEETEIEQEMERIIQYLGQVRGKGAETRKVSDDFEKARSATSKAFWRIVNQIRNDLPQFATRLEKSCTVGMICNYTPEVKIDWIL